MLDPTLSACRSLAMLTHDGARVLGLDHICGALEPGLAADITIVRTGTTTDPEAAVIRLGGRATIEAVLSAGVWRVRGGRPALPVVAIEHAAAAARAVAERAIARVKG
jgi:cytosine/adenosine deaminase-related metal-dependent hydrolase